jgi:hypothetical protein
MLQFYLVMIATSAYIGPLPESACSMAAANLRSEGVVCREASALTACAVDGRPGTYAICPKFDFPQVTIKER